MKVERKDLGKSQVELTIEIPIDEIKPYLESAANKISKETKIDGFRPGKVPYNVLKEKVGEQTILQEAAEEIVNKTFLKAIEQEKLPAVGDPQIKIEKIAPGNPLVYKVIVALLPKMKLTDFKKVKVKKEKVEVSEKKFQQTLKDLRKMRATEKVVDREAKDGDKTEVDFDVFVDRVAIEGGSAKKQPVIIGEGTFIPGFEEKLVGMKAGDEKTFELKFPADYFQKNLAGKKAEFKVKLISVFQVDLPKEDDKFAQALGQFKTYEELKTKIKENIKLEEEQKNQHKFQASILEKIIELSDFEDMPDVLIESEKNRMVAEMKDDLEKNSLKWDDYLKHLKKTEEDMRKEFHDQAEKRAKSALVTREVAIGQKIKVSEKDIDTEIEKLAVVYQHQPEMAEQFKSPDYRKYLERILINKKVLEHLENSVTIE